MATMDAAHAGIFPATTGNTVDLTGYGTAWTPGTPGSPTFTVSGGTGSAITSQVVVDATHATLKVTAGTLLGPLTVTDPSTGATATVQVKPPIRFLPRRRR